MITGKDIYESYRHAFPKQYVTPWELVPVYKTTEYEAAAQELTAAIQPRISEMVQIVSRLVGDYGMRECAKECNQHLGEQFILSFEAVNGDRYHVGQLSDLPGLLAEVEQAVQTWVVDEAEAYGVYQTRPLQQEASNATA